MQTIITMEINKACFTMTILMMISAIDFHNWNRKSTFHDVSHVDYRVRMTEIDSLINIIGFSCMLSGCRTSILSTWCMSRTLETRETASFLHLVYMHTMALNYSNRMYSFCESVKNATHHGALCLSLKPRLCRYQSNSIQFQFQSTSWNTVQ